MGDVVVLGGETRLDIPPERVLNGALAAGLKRVVVIGVTADDEPYYASSFTDLAEIAYRIGGALRAAAENSVDD